MIFNEFLEMTTWWPYIILAFISMEILYYMIFLPRFNEFLKDEPATFGIMMNQLKKPKKL